MGRLRGIAERVFCEAERERVSRAGSRAHVVTCTSGQTQTAVTDGGSDIILSGLAGSSHGIIQRVQTKGCLNWRGWGVDVAMLVR